MNKAAVIGIVAAGIAAVCIAFVVVLLLIKLLWAWTVPDLFPGAVEKGLVAGSISWLTAAKVALFVAILSAISQSHRSRKTR